MEVKTGVIAAAGSGTRMLPVTLGYPKELLPVINQPALQLIIDEYITAGLNRIIIITGENAAPLHRQYDLSNAPARGKHKALDDFVDRLADIEIIFEPQAGPYGNGTPLLVAQQHIPAGAGFLYAYGDDILKTKKSFAQQLIELHHATGALAVGVQPVAWEEVVRYGIVELQEGTTNVMRDVIEKPPRAEAKSNLAMFGRFLLSHDVIQILREIPLGQANELWLTDAVREYVRRGGRVVVNPVTDGEWLTIGDPVNYLQTLIEYALEDAEIRAALEPRIRRRLNL
ncbi:MAG: NTP transferase domain-containing protein [Acidobacteria bacterium]|nr:NTP transferase domain-containing protein [Acidobacteriota bacterium]MBI3421796.1 NTP transferase domain-containing protein [Acidobacteriota bacterium]